MGPGMVVKAVAPRQFSIVAFGIAQVLIDLEVLWNMVRHDTQSHTFLHTYLGASLIVLVAMPLGKFISTQLKRDWNLLTGSVSCFDIKITEHTPCLSAFLGASIGAYSHVLFDSFYHLDIEPFQPWSASNPCQGIIEPFQMEVAFNILFILGFLCFIAREILSRRPFKTPSGNIENDEAGKKHLPTDGMDYTDKRNSK